MTALDARLAALYAEVPQVANELARAVGQRTVDDPRRALISRLTWRLVEMSIEEQLLREVGGKD